MLFDFSVMVLDNDPSTVVYCTAVAILYSGPFSWGEPSLLDEGPRPSQQKSFWCDLRPPRELPVLMIVSPSAGGSRTYRSSGFWFPICPRTIPLPPRLAASAAWTPWSRKLHLPPHQLTSLGNWKTAPGIWRSWSSSLSCGSASHFFPCSGSAL